MKKLWIKISLLVMFIFAIYPYGKFNVYALDGTCFPTWDGDWILNTYLDGLNCTFPSGGYKIYGNVYVGRNGDFTITIPDSVVMGVDLRNKKIEFKSPSGAIRGKIKLQGTAKIDNSIYKRYYYPVSYSNNGIKRCPGGTVVLYSNKSGVITKDNTETVSPTGTMYCARIGPNSSLYNCYSTTVDGQTAIVCERK